MSDWRAAVARFYDLGPHFPEDIPFYLARMPAGSPSVLELGCGTGRVSVVLAGRASRFLGVDSSAAMLEIARKKLDAAGLEAPEVELLEADITEIEFRGSYDFIIAPFRVLQNLETNDQVSGLFTTIRRNLASGGRCILNAFHPNASPAEMRKSWCRPATLAWSVPTADGHVECHDVRKRVQPDPLVLYPDLVYSRFVALERVEEVVLSIAMRCYYPDELTALVEGEGFMITGAWGGYSGERYGHGSELVVEFTAEL